MKTKKIAVSLLLLSSLLVGCNSNPSTDSVTPPTEQTTTSQPNTEESINTEIPEGVTEIKVQENLHLYVGDKKQVAYEVLPANASDKRVTFKVDDESVCSVSDDGTVTALKEGNCQLSIVSVSNPSVSSVVSITVDRIVEAEDIALSVAGSSVVEKEEIDGSIINKYVLKTNSEYQLDASVLPSDATDKELVYTVEEGKEDYLTIDENGKITTYNKAYIRIKVTVSHPHSSLFKDIYFAIYSENDFLMKKLDNLKTSTYEKEREQGVASSLNIKKLKSNGDVSFEDTITAQLYLDEVREEKTSTSSSSNYVKRRKVIDNHMVTLTYDLENTLTDFEKVEIKDAYTAEQAKFESTTLYYDRSYGLSGIVFDNFLTRSDEMGSDDAKAAYEITDENNVFTIKANYAQGNAYYTEYYSKILTLTYDVNFVVTKAQYKALDYGYDNPFDEEGNLLADAKPSSTMDYNLTLTLGEKTQALDPLTLDPYYYQDFDVDFECTNSSYKKYYVGQYYNPKVKTFAPETASALIDDVKVTDIITDKEKPVAEISNKGFRITNVGTATIVVTSSKGVKKEYQITAEELPVENIKINYRGSTSLLPGEVAENISATVSPIDCIDRNYTASIIEGNDLAVLEEVKDRKGVYTLKINESVKQEGKVTLEFVTSANSSAGTPLKATISFDIVLPLDPAAIEENLINHEWYLEEYGDIYTCKFNADHTGKYQYLYSGWLDTDIEFEWSIQNGEIVLSNQNLIEGYDEITSMVLDKTGTKLSIKVSYSTSVLERR